MIASSGGTTTSVLITAVVIVLAFAWALLTINKRNRKLPVSNRCEGCGGRLRARNGEVTPVCRKCGTRQSWASRR